MAKVCALGVRCSNVALTPLYTANEVDGRLDDVVII